MTSSLFRTPSAVIHTTLVMTMTTAHPKSCYPAVKADVRTIFSYRPLDPYALSMSFSYLDSPPVNWVCARDLVREGLTQPAGEGDVRIHSDRAEMIITLDSPEGRAQLTVNRSELAAFIDQIYEAVPEGRESEYFSIDEELEFLA